MKFHFPYDIFNYILFKFIDDIEYRITFKKIKKINLDNFQNIVNSFNKRKRYIQIYKPLTNDNIRILILNINIKKYYKIIYYLDNEKYILVNIDIIDLNNPMYNIFLAELLF